MGVLISLLRKYSPLVWLTINTGFSVHLDFCTLLLPCMFKKKKKEEELYTFTRKQGREMHCVTAHCSLPQTLKSCSGALPWAGRAWGREVLSLLKGKEWVLKPSSDPWDGYIPSLDYRFCDKTFSVSTFPAGFLQEVLPSLWLLLRQWEGLCLLPIRLYGLKEWV